MGDTNTYEEGTPVATAAPTTPVTLPRIIIPPIQPQSSVKLNPNGSPIKRGMSAKSFSKKSILAEDKLEDINKQLAEVRRLRAEITSVADKRTNGKRVDYSVKPKKSFHHPKLDIVIGEIVYSPYMTKPNEKYHPDTFKMAEKLREMKRRGVSFSDVPSSEKPYNERVAKNKFIREVVNFNPGFSPHDHKPNLRASTGNLTSMIGTFSQSTLGSEYKSLLLQSAEARGGPVKFKQQLREGQVPRSPSSQALFADSLTSDGSSGNMCSSRNSSRGGGSAKRGAAAKHTSPPSSSSSLSFLTAAPASPEEAKARRNKSRGSLGVSFDPTTESAAVEGRTQSVADQGRYSADTTLTAADDDDDIKRQHEEPHLSNSFVTTASAATGNEPRDYAAAAFEEQRPSKETEEAEAPTGIAKGGSFVAPDSGTDCTTMAAVATVNGDADGDYATDDFVPEGDREVTEAVAEGAVEEVDEEQTESCMSPHVIEEEAHCSDYSRATAEELDEVIEECVSPV